MRSKDEIEKYVKTIVLCIMRESKHISYDEAEILAYKGICRYNNLCEIRETPLALQLIEEYSREKKHTFPSKTYYKDSRERKEYNKRTEAVISKLIEKNPEMALQDAYLYSYKKITKEMEKEEKKRKERELLDELTSQRRNKRSSKADAPLSRPQNQLVDTWKE